MKEKFRTIMTKRGPVTIFVVMLVIVCIFALRSFAGWGEQNPTDNKEKLLYYISLILRNGHYQEQNINDSFSLKVFVQYVNSLDPSRDIFYQKDIQAFESLKFTLDDEMLHKKPIEFLPLVSHAFNIGLKEADSLRKFILSKPFSFDKDEYYIPLDGEDMAEASVNVGIQNLSQFSYKNYPISLAEKADLWRKKLKRECLDAYFNAKKQELEKQKDTAYKKWISDDTLEHQSRTNIIKRYDRFFNRLYKHFGESDQFKRYLNTIMSITDPHSGYFSPVDTRSYEENTSGKFYGIGALLTSDGNHVKIVSISPGGAAWKSKMFNTNDVIIKVAEGDTGTFVDLVGYEVSEAVKLIRGDKGTKVRLALQKADGSVKEVSLIRDKIFINQTFARAGIIPYKGKKMGYIYLPEFYNSMDKQETDNPQSSLDVKKELEKLKAQSVEGIVLDLRNNGGGYLMDAIRMAGLFIPAGPIVQVKDKDQEAYPLNDSDSSVVYSGPLVILLNEYSASASEILAAAMQDYGRALVVGSTSTFGKGTVQRGGLPIGSLFGDTKEDLGTVNLTIQKFYRINGQSTQLRGVRSDVNLPSIADFLPVREKDLPFAIGYDTVKSTKYDKFNPSNSQIASVVKKINALVNQSTYYDHVKRYGKYLASQRYKPIPLEWNKYTQLVKERDKLSKSLDSFRGLVDSIHVKIIKEDSVRYTKMDSAESILFFQWYKDLNRDVTLSHTIDILSHLISAKNTEKEAATLVPKSSMVWADKRWLIANDKKSGITTK